MIVFIQLTIAGTDTGPFDLYSNSDGYVTHFITGVSRSTLITGNNYTVPDDALYIKITSTGVCTNDIIITIGTTTSTSTSSTSTSSTSTTSSTSSSTSTSTSSTTTSTTTAILCFTYTLSTTAPTFTFDYNYLDCAGEYTASSLSGEGNTEDICAQVDTVAISSGDGNSSLGSSCYTTTSTSTSSTTTTTTTL